MYSFLTRYNRIPYTIVNNNLPTKLKKQSIHVHERKKKEKALILVPVHSKHEYHQINVAFKRLLCLHSMYSTICKHYVHLSI